MSTGRKIMFTKTKALRDLAINRVHAEAKRLNIKVKTEKISPTRFVVKAHIDLIDGLVHKVASDMQAELSAEKQPA